MEILCKKHKKNSFFAYSFGKASKYAIFVLSSLGKLTISNPKNLVL